MESFPKLGPSSNLPALIDTISIVFITYTLFFMNMSMFFQMDYKDTPEFKKVIYLSQIFYVFEFALRFN